ncbi:hypothetical protein IVA96_01755 [Bradyrhizobium sp. 159]|uniref:hypothetical protein n=1 Tax=Bradyrhizobium sp. 159 TaxID=2782632 RepID=UPI001FF9A577|nr:hypothetical protein [Bradyrhizobium sp. 159]MCK1615439.1 hypothetical protein [Bradyrhizobium sp. 159]
MLQTIERERGAQRISMPLACRGAERIASTDPNDFKAAQWQLCPNAVVFETRGDCVIIDGAGRPIARVFADESTEVLSPDAKINAVDLTPALLHYDFGLPPGQRARKKIVAYIDKYGLAPELRRRRELLRCGKLAGGWGL